jgi:hypothetical protein
MNPAMMQGMNPYGFNPMAAMQAQSLSSRNLNGGGMSPTSPFPMQGNANPMMAAMQAQSLSSRNLNMNGGGMSPTSPFPMQQEVGNPYAMNPMAAAFQMQGGNPYAMNNQMQMGAFQGQQSTSAKSNPMLSSSSKKMTSAPVNATTSPLFLNNNITINEESSPGTSPTVVANEGVASPPDATDATDTTTAPSPSPSSTTN